MSVLVSGYVHGAVLKKPLYRPVLGQEPQPQFYRPFIPPGESDNNSSQSPTGMTTLFVLKYLGEDPRIRSDIEAVSGLYLQL